MSIFDTYSKRRKKVEKAGTPDVYQYDHLPEPLRVQVIHIWNDALGIYYVPESIRTLSLHLPTNAGVSFTTRW